MLVAQGIACTSGRGPRGTSWEASAVFIGPDAEMRLRTGPLYEVFDGDDALDEAVRRLIVLVRALSGAEFSGEPVLMAGQDEDLRPYSVTDRFASLAARLGWRFHHFEDGFSWIVNDDRLVRLLEERGELHGPRPMRISPSSLHRRAWDLRCRVCDSPRVVAWSPLLARLERPAGEHLRSRHPHLVVRGPR